ncbi:phosphatase PAP2 family protein [Clostridium bowmanii]|uniref:phosphatase PAP2 family protein n=1 Tax=Clostridium bowmanii TaxID=132925 RepID=UPI001C0D0049|nr:phosphatase PAP2 family protein [Clostridium bowmanii]MBU3187997.1 phosphatase PAP2 family protein [Clostridium bowmanii]MCA1072176.1 phosphatase PAP2 family protein [Clostridium bowmanii]
MQIEIIKFIQSITSPFLDVFFQLVTMTGEEYFYIIAAAIIFWCVNKKFGYKLGFALLTGTIVNTVLKDLVNASRPIGISGIRSLRVQTATGQSFPSGHTQGASTFWVSWMVRLKRKWIYIVGISAIILVAFSRMYLGVHYPIDVIGGVAVGTIWVFISNYIFEYAESTKKAWILMIIVVPMLIGMIFLKEKTYYTISGTVFGFFIGYVLESKYVQYDVRNTKIKQLIKLLFGLTVLITLKFILKKILPINIFADFFRYFVVGLWITIGAPCIFKRFLGNTEF